MFPNFRVMGASTLAAILALFFAFGVYASLRVSREPLVAAPSRSAPLQLVGLNVAMLPITVLEPFARQHSGRPDDSSLLAYSTAQTRQPPLPVTSAGDTHEDDAAAADASNENSDQTKTNSDVTQTADTASLEAARDVKSPDEAMQQNVEAAENSPPNVTESAALPAPAESVPLPAALPAASPPADASAPPQNSPVERTAVIETMPATAVGNNAVATEIPAKEKKKRRVARRHIYRAQPRAVAQDSTPQQSSIWPAGIGGPLVSPPKR